MEYLENVAPEEIPEDAVSMRSRPGTGWSAFAQHVIEDARVGRVTVVKMKDTDEYKKMRNGTQQYFRKAKYTVEARILKKPDGLHVYILAEPEPQPLEITRTKPTGTKPVEPPPPVRRNSVGNRNSR